MSDPTGGWAKATEEASEATKEAIRTSRDIGAFLAPAFQPLVGVLADRFEVWRAERQVRLAERYLTFLQAKGLAAATREIAPSFLLPLIESGSIEADDDLQDVWATMLANAADAGSETERRTAFIGMLREMSRFDVLVLSRLEEETARDRLSALLETHRLPEAAVVRDQSKTEIAPPRYDVEISLGNLARLGCLSGASTFGGDVNFGLVRLTQLGRSFIRACTAPRLTAPC